MSGGAIGQWVVRPDHHEGYITLAEFEENQRILRMNWNAPGKPGRGRGHGLLQGLVRCGRHDEHVMSTAYQPGAPRAYALHCMGELFAGGVDCMTLSGLALQRVVIELALPHLSPLRIREVRRLWEEARDDARRGSTRHAQALQRARDRHERLRALFYECDPKNVRTRSTLEKDVEEQAKEVEHLEEEAREPDSPDVFTDARWKEVERLSADVWAIWNADTTEIADRKELLRTLISNIVIEQS